MVHKRIKQERNALYLINKVFVFIYFFISIVNPAKECELIVVV